MQQQTLAQIGISKKLKTMNEPPPSFKQIIQDIYEKHNPSKLNSIDSLLTKYKGKERKLIAALRKKYAIASSPPPSSSLPTDFFDSKPKETKKDKDSTNTKEWEDFQAFAKSVSETTVKAPIEVNDTREEEDRIEQNEFLQRVESIKRKRNKSNDNVNDEKKNESDTMLLGLLRKRKENRKRRRMNAASRSNKLDPLDWRTKSTIS